MRTTTETTIDRSDEFDQTKKHTPDPLPPYTLMQAAEPKGIEAVFASGRPMPTIILQNRIIVLERELHYAEMARDKYRDQLTAAENKIAGFERLSRTLSEAVDASAANLRAIANAAMLDITDPIARTPAETLIAAPEITDQDRTRYGTDAVDMMAL